MTNLFLDGSKLFHQLDRLESWTRGEPIAPVHAEVGITSKCNQRCYFCYADHLDHKMGTLQRDMLMQLMGDLGATGIRSCLFAGDGEPLSHKDCVDAVIAGVEAGVDMAVNSNGVLLSESMAEVMLPYLTWMRFSIMGHDAETYSKIHVTNPRDLEKALANITMAADIKKRRNLNVTIGIQSVLMPENGHGLAILAEKARQTGADYFVIKPFSYNPLNEYDGGRPLDLVREFENILREAEALTTDDFAVIVRRNTFSDNGVRDYDKCLGLPFITQIAADGKVYSCCPFFGNEDYVLGDLHEHRFQDLWFSDKAEAVRKRVEETQDVHACMTFCRHHQINRQLWQLKNPPDHVNFI